MIEFTYRTEGQLKDFYEEQKLRLSADKGIENYEDFLEMVRLLSAAVKYHGPTIDEWGEYLFNDALDELDFEIMKDSIRGFIVFETCEYFFTFKPGEYKVVDSFSDLDIETFKALNLDNFIEKYFNSLSNDTDKKQIDHDIRRGFSGNWEDYFFIAEKGLGIAWSH